MANWIIERGPNGQYPQCIELAFKASEAFDLDAAVDWFKRAMKSSDVHEAASGLIGAAALESKWGSQKKAIKMLREVVDLGRLDAFVNYGKTLLEDGDLLTAERYFQMANVEGAEDYVRGQALNAIGCVELEKGNMEAAIDYFEQSAALGENLAKNNLGELAQERGDINQARYWFWQIADEELDAKMSYSRLTHELIEELKKPWCFPEKLEELSKDFDDKVRHVVASNTTTPIWVLEELLEDVEPGVNRSASQTLKKIAP